MAALGISSAFADQTFSVELVDFRIRPDSYTVRAGEKVTFNARNTGQRPHDIKIDGPGGFSWQLVPGDANNVAPGTSATGEMTFNTPGTYDMYCPVGQHRANGMVASFTVTAAAAAAAPATQLPKTGEPAMLLGGLLAAAGALLTTGGLFLRRRA